MWRYMILVAAALPLSALSNYEVAERSDAAYSGFGSSVATLRMVLKNADGQQSERELGIKTLESKGGDRSLITFFKPADIKGTQLLTHEEADGEDRQWIYLPALKRVKRIAGSSRSGAFVGSEFSYEDLSSFDFSKYRYEGEAEEVPCGEKRCYVGVRTPTDAGSAYSSQKVWVDAGSFLVQKIEYYDRKKALAKSAYFSGYRKIGGFWRVGSIRMVNHRSGKETLLEWTGEKVGLPLTAGDFDKRRLAR